MKIRYFCAFSTSLLPVLIFSLLFNSGCGFKYENNSGDKNVKTKDQTSALSWYDVENENAAGITLSDELEQISGLCFTADNRLFCDGDDSSGVFQIDPDNGKIIKVFYVGEGKKKRSDRIKSSFEDLAIVGDRFFILQSHGSIFECSEGADGQYVDYKVYKTKLNKDNNIEGLCFDPATNALLLACKDYPGDGYDKRKTIYSFSLATMTLDDTPRFAIRSNRVKRNTIDGEFRPSGIARHNFTGTFFVIASHGHTIIEIGADGEILNQKDLPEELHRQPEGIAFDSENTLFISDEGRGEHPRLTAYKMLKNK